MTRRFGCDSLPGSAQQSCILIVETNDRSVASYRTETALRNDTAARMRSLFSLALSYLAIACCGCHSTSDSVRQTRAESISVDKKNDSTLLASGNGNLSGGLVPSAAGASEASNSGSPVVTQTASSTSTTSRWTNLFGRKETPDRVVLPRNDQQAESSGLDGSAEKTAANEF